ncbi:XRE family transcriptional regulator [Anabaena sp. UHCC 0187]|uniref:XRE family transcriptional regulator n=1 Tax=Anabaena sp. UHCC 0187 TaxID=2590018 RepID=UPI001446045E|nr:XRE family transcriptional regulator [Anabaena sp. UHCC 0187]MTJ15030.1 XRE family transcriptional regulator [Anabaena sp. UHCC 0187]
MNKKKLRIYISGALTGIENPTVIKDFYVAIGLLCEKVGFQAYVPHLNTDPLKHPNITPSQVFQTDKSQVSQADLVIGYIGYASIGVGMELAYAETNSIPIILIYETGKTISRFPRGIPTVLAEIDFQDYQDALVQLEIALKKWNT